MANPALLITVVTGVIQLWRMDAGHLWDTTHGRLVLFKVLPMIALIVIGTATRQFVHAQMSRAEVMSTPLAAKLRRAVSIEAVFGVVILGITAWMLSTQPGNLVAGPRSSDDFAVQLQFDDADATLDAKLSLDPARVGTNEVLLEIRKPAEGISSITVEFSPPASEVNAHPVTMTITELTGTGAALLPRAGGLPLDAAGAWSVKVTVTAAAGVFTQSQVLDVRSNGTTEQVSIPSIEQPPVTAVPTSSTITTVIPG